MSEDHEQPRSSIIERHAQTIIAAILLGLVLWAGNTLLTIKDDVTTLKVTVNTLQSQLQNAGDDRFRGSDWRREKEIIDDKFRRLEAEIEKHRQWTEKK